MPAVEDMLKAVRNKYPTPLGDTHAAFLLECARTTGYGLLKKESGHRVILPDGQGVAQDILMTTDGFHYDFLIDGEGEAEVAWQEKGPVDPGRYYKVDGTVEQPSNPDDDGHDHGHGDIWDEISIMAMQIKDLTDENARLVGVLDGFLTASATLVETVNHQTEMLKYLMSKRTLRTKKGGWPGHTHEFEV